jgi:D-glycero-alpha-D-manno-heptose 1-phosphate guanylyltransferase
MQNVNALILVGGLGTRLKSAVPDVPKPLAPVAGRPFLDILLAKLQGAGLREVILCLGYGAQQIETHCGDGARFGLHIRYSHERDLRGTGGAVKLAESLIGSNPFLLLNGDSYCETDFAALLAFHAARGALATLAAPLVEERARYGSLVIGNDGAVTGFVEKGEVSGAGRINGGIYVLSRAVLDMIPSGQACSLEREVFPRLCGAGLFAFVTDGLFIDIGVPDDWQRAQTIFAREGAA